MLDDEQIEYFRSAFGTLPTPPEQARPAPSRRENPPDPACPADNGLARP